MTIESCIKLNEIMQEQRVIIRRHLNEHAWFNHIEDKDQAVLDFIEKYGWVLRESYCDLCVHRKDCLAYREYLNKYVKEEFDVIP